MSQPQSDRNLLFGVLALQMDFIDRDALVRGMNAWLLDKAKPLGRILMEQKALDPDAHALLDALVRKRLEKHGGDAERSLAALSSGARAADALKDINDPDLHQSIARLGRPIPPPVAPVAPRDARPRFRILRPHAREALGRVSVALDAELNREVAVKELEEQQAGDPQKRARFLREARVTGGLEHPGVLPVYGLGSFADGRPFYAMRFVRGEHLQDAAARFHAGKGGGAARAVEFRKLLKRFVDVCNTMAYAHSRGVLHRDLKPGNVLLGPYGETLVVDWGLARSLNRREGEPAADARPLIPAAAADVEPTAMGAAVGTPPYMSPEQAAGRLDQLGTASDVYSLGAILYCVLTGKPPFADEDAGAVLRKVERGDFIPPGQLNRRAPPALAAICQKAMARDPAARYPTPLALAADVEHWLADEPASAYREPWLPRLVRWLRRHRVKAAVAAVVLATAVPVLAVGFVLTEQARAAEARLRVQEEQARADADRRAGGEKQAHDQADAERVKTLRSLLTDYRESADADLAAARLRWDAVAGQERQKAALDLIGQAGRQALEAEAALRDLGNAAGDLARTEPGEWARRRLELRTEAARWLTRMVVGRGPTTTIPFGLSGMDLANAAVSPDGAYVASLDPSALHVNLVRFDGQVLGRLAIPQGAPALRWFVSLNRLRFPMPRRVELDLDDQVLAWTLPDGKAELRQRTPAEAEEWKTRQDEAKEKRDDSKKRKPPRTTGATRTAEVSAGSITSQWQWWVTVRSRKDDNDEQIAWRTADSNAAPSKLRFSDDCRLLYILTSNNVLVAVDLLTGLTAQEPLPTPDQNSTHGDLLPWGGGVATLEATKTGGLNPTARVTLWTVNMPPAWKCGLTTPGAAPCLDLAGDGLLAVGSDDHAVRLWRGPDALWSAGVSADLYSTEIERISFYVWWDMDGFGDSIPGASTNRNQNHITMFLVGGGMRKEFGDYDDAYAERAAGRPAPVGGRLPRRGRRAAVFLEEKKGDRYTLSYQSLLIDADPDRVVRVRREARRVEPPRLTPDENTHNVTDAARYHWWGFPGGGTTFLVDGVSRLADGRVEDRTELYDMEGRPLHVFPTHGPGRILAGAANRMVAITAGETDGPRTTLDLWSLAEGKSLGGLGAYELGPEAPDAPSPLPLSPEGGEG